MERKSIFWRFFIGIVLSILCLKISAHVSFAESSRHIENGINKNLENSNFNREPYAKFRNIRVEHNLTEGGKKGMKIYTTFEVFNMKGIKAYLAINFLKLDGTNLIDRNGRYASPDKKVAIYGEIIPGFQSTVYDDFDLFMPYEELELPAGNHELQMDVDVVSSRLELITHLTFYRFFYERISGGRLAQNPRATVEKVWVDYDVMQAGRKGMLIHLKANVFDMKGRDGNFAFYIQKPDGTPVTTVSRTFQSLDSKRPRQLALYYPIKPRFDNTVYEDASVFLPYKEINLPRGAYDLQIDIDLVEKNGVLIEHLYLHDFWFEV